MSTTAGQSHLLDFPRLFTILLLILAMVTAIDRASAWLRARLL